jgi:hypothetical protein
VMAKRSPSPSSCQDCAVVAALDLVRWELSLLRLPGVASGGVDSEMSFDEIRVLLQNPRKG